MPNVFSKLRCLISKIIRNFQLGDELFRKLYENMRIVSVSRNVQNKAFAVGISSINQDRSSFYLTSRRNGLVRSLCQASSRAIPKLHFWALRVWFKYKCHVDQWIPEVTSNMSSMVSPPYINGLILSLTQADWNFGRVYGNVRYLGTNSKSFSDCSCERSLTYLLQFS